MSSSKQGLAVLISQITDLLFQIEPHQFRQPLEEFNGSTLGQHFRHVVEFFQCFEAGCAVGLVDYAARKRQMLLEDQPRLAAAACADFLENLEKMDEVAALLVSAEFSSDATAARPAFSSSVGRELMYVFDHAVHHLAII